MYEISMDEFEELVADAIDSIPDKFFNELENVVFVVEEEPTPEQCGRADDGQYSGSGDLLGLYDGISMLDRGNSYGAVDDWPDQITAFKGPHERMCDSREQLAEEVRKTIIHEVAHYFGMNEEQVDEMGYA